MGKFCCNDCRNRAVVGLPASCAPPCPGVSWQGAGPVSYIDAPGSPTVRRGNAPSLSYVRGPHAVKQRRSYFYPRPVAVRNFPRSRGATVGLPLPPWISNPRPAQQNGEQPAEDDSCMGWPEVAIAAIAGLLIGAAGGYTYRATR